MVKCSICGEKIEVTFLGKISGTRVGKKCVCPVCQSKFKTKDDLLDKLGK